MKIEKSLLTKSAWQGLMKVMTIVDADESPKHMAIEVNVAFDKTSANLVTLLPLGDQNGKPQIFSYAYYGDYLICSEMIDGTKNIMLLKLKGNETFEGEFFARDYTDILVVFGSVTLHQVAQ